jgi:hydroxymethylpyrimidine/phosphomethylpyrimidine kinase
LSGSGAMVDMFVSEATGVVKLPTARVETTNTHGTGCTLASSIAAALAKQAGGWASLSAHA